MRFSPEGSTKIGATPLDSPGTTRTWRASIPRLAKFARASAPNASSPTHATIITSLPRSAAATAWFAPLPPGAMAKRSPSSVSPRSGIRVT